MDEAIGIGHDEFFKTEAYPLFKKFYEVCNQLLGALNLMLVNRGESSEKVHVVIRFLCMMTGISFQDVGILVSNGCGIGGMKISRSALEYAINAEYLRLFPVEYGRFRDWSWVEQHRRVMYMKEHMPSEFAKIDPAKIAATETNYFNVKATFTDPKGRLSGSWCRHNLAQRAEKTDFEGPYKVIYTTGSELSHGSFGGIAIHLEGIDGEKVYPAIPPSLTLCPQALQAAHFCTFRALQTLTLINGRDSTPSLVDLKKDYEYAWPQESRAAS
ncbi:MAG: DUF5677 domain-containing protein [Candidatus Acidiferrum sp.]